MRAITASSWNKIPPRREDTKKNKNLEGLEYDRCIIRPVGEVAMRKRKSDWSRRLFLKGAGMSPFVTGLASVGAPATLAAREGTKTRAAAESIYAELKVRTLINGRGVATFYSSTLMPPEVHRAMERASDHFVEIVELQKAVGARLAGFGGTEAGVVCSASA